MNPAPSSSLRASNFWSICSSNALQADMRHGHWHGGETPTYCKGYNLPSEWTESQRVIFQIPWILIFSGWKKTEPYASHLFTMQVSSWVYFLFCFPVFMSISTHAEHTSTSGQGVEIKSECLWSQLIFWDWEQWLRLGKAHIFNLCVIVLCTPAQWVHPLQSGCNSLDRIYPLLPKVLWVPSDPSVVPI